MGERRSGEEISVLENTETETIELDSGGGASGEDEERGEAENTAT